MTWWDKLKAIGAREAGAVREGASRTADALDDALAKKERELSATPAERVDMLLDEIADEDTQFDEIEAKLRTESAERSADAGLEPATPAPAPPDHTGIAETLIVEAIDAEASDGRMSHIVKIDGDVLASLRPDGVDAVVADLLAEVMVLDAARRRDDILLRTPTLTDSEVADLVARVAVRHLPRPASPLDNDPGDKTTTDEGYSSQ